MKEGRGIVQWALLVGLGASTLGGFAAQPNVVLILTQDQGYHDAGYNGSKDVQTPNLDSIARDGVRFTSGYVSSAVYSPSVAGLLVGRYQERFGYDQEADWQRRNSNLEMPLGETTLAAALGKVGYHSGFIGEWNLGYDAQHQPLKRGFDEFFGFLGPGHAYLSKEWSTNKVIYAKTEEQSYHLPVIGDADPLPTQNYLTDDFSDAAVRFIRQNKTKRFFLCLAYNAPHSPLQALDKYLNRFPQIKAPLRGTYVAMLSAVDDGVGRVLSELSADDLETQTLVIYLSASGGSLNQNSSDNYPFRGARDSPWEGGWRVPFAMAWPDHLPKGLVYDQPVLSLDLYATIAALAGLPNDPEYPLDGVNLMPYLSGQNTNAPHSAIFLRLPNRNVYVVRKGDYKLIYYGANQPVQLFNLARDNFESDNLASEKPEVVRELENKLLAWVKDVDPSQSSYLLINGAVAGESQPQIK